MATRREFVGAVAAGAAGLAMRGTAKSYAQIAGANARVNFAVIGLNGRAGAHLSSLHANQKDARITHVCDVDRVILDRFAGKTTQAMGETPKSEQDFRRVLESKDVDAITIATPDHWHAPMGILGLAAGKHVYVEKPCSYNPHEGELLVAAAAKYGRVCQMGSQQRSSPHTIEIVGRIHEGLIGRAYWGETWYTNRRKPIGIGKAIPVPATLDWDLWQGPAPRTAYKDNVHPYNWHWFRRWGTGETLNNGTHEVDVARWALGAGWPTRVTAAGGRYAAKDDWEFYDTLDTSFEYPDQLITWKGDCCNGKKTFERDRGVMVHGTKGSVLIDRAGFEVYDGADKKIEEYKVPGHTASASADTVGADSMTDLHFANMIAAIRTGEKLHQPVAQGNVAVTILQLSNIAYFTNRDLRLDPVNGHIVGDAEAEAMTRRKAYAPGWEPKI
ncbi:MAG TPA: Gfo/Idh/MocA family oxidoreductase [Acidobacteriaceae bacterium]|nr:Gfo/Idh/MocA family oxidoreductase [Acidobacteriaceae bacterium]